MRTNKGAWVLLIMGTILGLIMLIGALISGTYRIENVVDVEAPIDSVYAELLDLETWQEWTSLKKEQDPSLEFTFEGKGEEATMKWKGDLMGEGEVKISRAVPGKGMSYDMVTYGGDMLAHGQFMLKKLDENKTEVTWIINGEIKGNPLIKLSSLFMSESSGGEYQNNLIDLKSMLEE